MGGGESSLGGMAVALVGGIGLAGRRVRGSRFAFQRRVGGRGRVDGVGVVRGGVVGRGHGGKEKRKRGGNGQQHTYVVYVR